MGIKRNGVKLLLKHEGDLVEKVMTMPQFEAFIKSYVAGDENNTDRWFMLAKKSCTIDKYGNEVVTPAAIESYYGFEDLKAKNHDDFYASGPDLMDIIRVNTSMDASREASSPRKRISFKVPDESPKGVGNNA